MALDHARRRLPLEKCDCQCCQIVRACESMQHNNTEETQPTTAFTFSAGSHAASHAGSSNLSTSSFSFLACHCYRTISGSVQEAHLANYVPGPQEFLRWHEHAAQPLHAKVEPAQLCRTFGYSWIGKPEHDRHTYRAKRTTFRALLWPRE
jgi:hypothetical protein